MLEKIVDSTCSSCHKKNLQTKQVTEGIYRCSHCQSQFSNQFISSTLQTRFALQVRKIVGLSILVSIALIASSVRSALASNQLPVTPSTFVTSESKTISNLPSIIPINQSLPSNPALISQAINGGGLTVSNGTGRDAYVKPKYRTKIEEIVESYHHSWEKD
jgi:hypothetical protein